MTCRECEWVTQMQIFAEHRLHVSTCEAVCEL